MFINHCSGLGAAVAVRAVEVESGDGVFAERAFESSAAIQRFGCVISHFSIVVLSPVVISGIRCATLG
jgi:hypothetical protein